MVNILHSSTVSSVSSIFDNIILKILKTTTIAITVITARLLTIGHYFSNFARSKLYVVVLPCVHITSSFILLFCILRTGAYLNENNTYAVRVSWLVKTDVICLFSKIATNRSQRSILSIRFLFRHQMRACQVCQYRRWTVSAVKIITLLFCGPSDEYMS